MSIKQSFTDAILNIRRHILISSASILVMALTVFTAASFSIVAWVISNVSDYLETRAQMTIFFRDEASVEDIKRFQAVLQEFPEIVSVEYVSKEEALNIYTSQHQDEPVLLESVTADIFPASLDVRAQNIANLTNLAEYLNTGSLASSHISEGDSYQVLGLEVSYLSQLDDLRPLIEELVFYKDAAKQLGYWLNVVRISGLSLVSFFGAVSMLIVLVAVGLNIRSSREEISIMKLVGATDRYVREPYLIQGLVIGLGGGLLSVLIFAGLAPLAKSLGSGLFSGIASPHITWYLLASFAGAQLLAGAAVGAAGSWIAVRRYLRV